jgi:hypothetical protein
MDKVRHQAVITPSRATAHHAVIERVDPTETRLP